MNQNFYSGFQNMNNSSFNNQPNFNQNQNKPTGNEYKAPKKNNLLIIIITVVAVLSIVVGCILMFSSDSKSNDKNNGNDKQNVKQITYFNSENKSKDSIFFNLESSSQNGKGVFFGIKGKDVASNLKFDSSSLYNSVLNLSNYYSSDGLSLYYNDEYFDFELESYDYKKDSTGEYYDDNKIVYRDGSFFVIETNIDNYLIYYMYDEEDVNWYDGDDIMKYWHVFDIYFCDSVDEAREKIDMLREKIDICVYDKKDGFDNCITEDGKKIDYKEYRYIKDVIVDSLKEYNLYLNSYEEVESTHYEELVLETYIEFEGIDEDDLTRFELDFRDYAYDKEEYNQSVKLNDMELAVRKNDTLYYAALSQSDGYINIYIDIPYGVEDNLENVQKALTSAFSKTK